MRNISAFKLKSNLHIVQGHKCIEMLDQRAMTCIYTLNINTLEQHTHTHTHSLKEDKQPLTMNESVVWSFPCRLLFACHRYCFWEYERLHATQKFLHFHSLTVEKLPALCFIHFNLKEPLLLEQTTN